MRKAIVLLAAFIMMPHLAFAATSISISAQTSGSVESTIPVYAYFYNDSAFVTGAVCTISGGFLPGPANFTYDISQYYLYYLYLSSAGTYSLGISCSKSGYEASDTLSLNVYKKASTLYMDTSAGTYNFDIGDLVTLRAYYQQSGTKISGATCTLGVTTPSGTTETIGMSEDAQQYSAQYTMSLIGQYQFKADCSSGKYASQSYSVYVKSNKHSTSLTRTTLDSAYYSGTTIKVDYHYSSAAGKQIISGANCRYELKKGSTLVSSGAMPYVENIYRISIPAPEASEGSYLLRATCEADKYTLAQNDAYIYVKKIPTSVGVSISTPSGAYSYAPASISASYTDARNGASIYGAECRTTFNGKKQPGISLDTYLPPVDSPVSASAEVCCSKANYADSCGRTDVFMSPQPITLGVIEMPNMLVVNENYSVGFRAMPTYYSGTQDISCSMELNDMEAPGAAKKISLARRGNEYRTNISFGQPGTVAIVITCGGKGYSESKLKSEVRVKMFSSSLEGRLTTVLGILGLVLLAATILISRKYKISA